VKNPEDAIERDPMVIPLPATLAHGRHQLADQFVLIVREFITSHPCNLSENRFLYAKVIHQTGPSINEAAHAVIAWLRGIKIVSVRMNVSRRLDAEVLFEGGSISSTLIVLAAGIVAEQLYSEEMHEADAFVDYATAQDLMVDGGCSNQTTLIPSSIIGGTQRNALKSFSATHPCGNW